MAPMRISFFSIEIETSIGLQRLSNGAARKRAFGGKKINTSAELAF